VNLIKVPTLAGPNRASKTPPSRMIKKKTARIEETLAACSGAVWACTRP
jgi:hypothetical protein